MNYRINIQVGSNRWSFPLLARGNFQKIIVPDVVVLNIWKIHDHRYDFDAFFYRSKHIISRCSFRSKSELYYDIQFLLEDELHFDLQ